ncbi:cytochrome P450 [Cladorrhinum sp. PSN332]|nr:cytochrome P450 [Cladorrhinum sp. PSN332]
MDDLRKVITSAAGAVNTRVIFIAIITASVIWYFISAIHAWYRLRHIPGPRLASFTYTWFGLWMWRGKITHILTKIHEKYGPLVRIGPNALLVSDPDTLFHINGVRSNYPRGEWYKSIRMDPSGNTMFTEPDTARHDARKAVVTSPYAGKSKVINFEAVVDAQLGVLVDRLAANYAGHREKALDLSRIIRYLTVDVITAVLLGQPWGNVADEADAYQFCGMMDARMPLAHTIGVTPSLQSVFHSSFFLSLAGPKPTDKTGIGKFIGVTKKDIEQRLKVLDGTEAGPALKNRNVLDEWLKLGLTSAECQREAVFHIPAGSETSATALTGTMFHLLTAPAAYRKLKDEIAQGIRDGRISSPITNDEAKALPYLQAVVFEGFRMSPPVNSGFSKRVPAAGDTICGKFVPGGTEIMWNGFEMMRSRQVFGSDVEIFRPERFIECDDKKRAKMVRVVELGFGHGRWMCPGKALAWVSLNKTYVEVSQLTIPETF